MGAYHLCLNFDLGNSFLLVGMPPLIVLFFPVKRVLLISSLHASPPFKQVLGFVVDLLASFITRITEGSNTVVEEVRHLKTHILLFHLTRVSLHIGSLFDIGIQ